MDFESLEQAAHEAADRWALELCAGGEPPETITRLARGAFVLFAIDGYGFRPVAAWTWPFDELRSLPGCLASGHSGRPRHQFFTSSEPWTVLLRAAFEIARPV